MNSEATLEETQSLHIKKYIYLGVKRLFDIVLSLIGCIFLLPIALIVKISYILNKDYESIFFSQDRIGKNGKTFKFYKFRSMVVNADEVLKELLKNDKDARKIIEKALLARKAQEAAKKARDKTRKEKNTKIQGVRPQT